MLKYISKALRHAVIAWTNNKMNKCLDNNIIPLVIIWNNGIGDSRIEVNKIINSDCHLSINDIVSNENRVKPDINGIPTIKII